MIFLHTQLKIKKILYFLALVLCAFGLTQTMSVAQEDNHRALALPNAHTGKTSRTWLLRIVWARPMEVMS